MKHLRPLLVLTLALFSAPRPFAVDFSLSFGAGGVFGLNWLRVDAQGGGLSADALREIEDSAKQDDVVYGFAAFVDAAYAEATVGLTFANAKLPEVSGSPDMKYSEVVLGLFGKFPFEAGDMLLVYPLAGIEYHLLQSVEGSLGSASVKLERVDFNDIRARVTSTTSG